MSIAANNIAYIALNSIINTIIRQENRSSITRHEIYMIVILIIVEGNYF